MARKKMPTGVTCVNAKHTSKSYIVVSARRGDFPATANKLNVNKIEDSNNDPAQLKFSGTVISYTLKRAIIQLKADNRSVPAIPFSDGVLSITLENTDVAPGAPTIMIEVADIVVEYIDDPGAP